jgi:hypothetical protein
MLEMNRARTPELFPNDAREQRLCERMKNTEEQIFCFKVRCTVIISTFVPLTCLFSLPVTAKKIIVKK